MKTCEECRAEILRLYRKHSPRCTWEDVARELESLEHNGKTVGYSGSGCGCCVKVRVEQDILKIARLSLRTMS